MRGQLIVLEGPDGAGKTTLAAAMANTMSQSGRPTKTLGLPGNVPGTLGNLIHRLHHDPAAVGLSEAPIPSAMQVLHAGSHIDSITRLIRPALEAGESVILDRFWWSTQIYGRITGVDEPTLSALEHLARHQWRNLVPNYAFLLLDSPINARPDNLGVLRDEYNRFLQREHPPFPVTRVPSNCLTPECRLQFVLKSLR